jgi:hypothetical protein
MSDYCQALPEALHPQTLFKLSRTANAIEPGKFPVNSRFPRKVPDAPSA